MGVWNWDATSPDTLAPSNMNLAAREAGVVAEEAEEEEKQIYQPTWRPPIICSSSSGVSKSNWVRGMVLPRDLGRHLTDSTAEPLSHHYPLQY